MSLTRTWNYDSRDEEIYARKLDLLQKAGEVRSWHKITKGSKEYPLIVNGKLICHHEPDFIVINKEGFQEVHECKGFTKNYNGMAVWNMKRKLFEACYPNIPYIVIWPRKDWQDAWKKGVKKPWTANKSKKKFAQRYKARVIDVDRI